MKIQTATTASHAEILALFKSEKCTSAFSNIVYSAPAMYEKGWIVEARDEAGALLGAYCVRHCTNKPQTSLYFITVAPEHRGTGVADALLEHLKAEAPSGRIVLGVNLDNERARAFYRRHGFAETGPCYQGKGVTMEWVL
jgi:ribosomal protein S18 acetylase RimI-like enzyme